MTRASLQELQRPLPPPPRTRMSRRDNTVDKFLNTLSRVVTDRDVYNCLGMELGFQRYELDGRWTNAMGE